MNWHEVLLKKYPDNIYNDTRFVISNYKGHRINVIKREFDIGRFSIRLNGYYIMNGLIMQVFTLKEVMQYIDSLPEGENYEIPF